MARRRAWGIALLALAVSEARAQQPDEAVAGLPELARIEQPGATPIVVRGTLAPRRARAMIALARAVQRDVLRRFGSGRDTSALPPVQLCLFERSAAYERFVAAAFGADEDHSELGFYSPYHRVAVANLARSVGNLRHELAHAVIGDDWPEIPDWINEGIGALYGTARQDGQGFRFLVNYRLRHLRAALRAGRLPDLAALSASGRDEVYGPESAAYYATARYVLLYLDRRGSLGEFVSDLRDGPLGAERQREVLGAYVDHARFVEWTGSLRLGRGRRPGQGR